MFHRASSVLPHKLYLRASTVIMLVNVTLEMKLKCIFFLSIIKLNVKEIHAMIHKLHTFTYCTVSLELQIHTKLNE